MTALPPIAKIAELLGGDVRGGEVLCPGPGHAAADRSLSIKPDPTDCEGFITHSFADDGWKECRDHVRKKLGLPEPKPESKKKSGAGKVWSTLGEYIYYDQHGERYLKIRKCRDETGKKQFPQYHWDGTGWAKGKPSGPKIPYRLPGLIAAPAMAVIFLCEGEKDADAVAQLGFVATTASEGAAAKWDTGLTQYFTDRHIIILPDADRPGRDHAQKVAKAISGVAASVQILDLYPNRHDGSDVSDWLANDTAGVELAKLARGAPLWEPIAGAPADTPAGDSGTASADDAELEKLARMAPLAYERTRKEAGQRLGVSRLSLLDALVKAKRAELGLDGAGSGLQGRAIAFPTPEPWPEPVDGAALLDEIAATLKRYVVMADHARYSAALWVPHTYLLDCFMISPRLAVRSPMKRCGKTTLLDVLGCLVMKALPTANVSAAALFRVVEGYRPTLLVDEADTFLAEADELKGILNSGHRRGGSVLRTVGDDHEPRAFATYAAVAIGVIGNLPDTLADRSISVDLKRKLPSEATKSFRVDRVGHLEVLARKTARWAADNADRIAAADPEMPSGLHSREADNWRPLFAIAAAAGGEWPKRVQAAATQAAAESETASLIELLLGDIREIFAKREANKVEPVDQIPSGDLVEALVGIEARPWAELGKSRKPLTQNRLARLLKPLSITSENIRIGDKVPKGYLLERFKEAFSRYLGPERASEPLHRYNADEMGDKCGKKRGTS